MNRCLKNVFNPRVQAENDIVQQDGNKWNNRDFKNVWIILLIHLALYIYKSEVSYLNNAIVHFVYLYIFLTL